MKALFLLLTLLFFSSISWAQPATMRIHMKDGKVRELAVDSVAQMNVSYVEAPRYNLIRTFRHSTDLPITDGWYYPSFKPMLKFGRDLEGYRVLLIANDTFRILSPPPSPDPFQAPLDSIVILNYYRDTNILSIDPMLKYGHLVSATWNNDTMYASHPLTEFVLNSQFQKTREPRRLISGAYTYSLDYDLARKKVLTVKSRNVDVSLGDLFEIDPNTKTEVVLDTGHQVSRAVYDPKDTNNIYYYCYGSYHRTENPNPVDAGYYRFNRSTKERQLLLPYISQLGPNESISGFDIHPSNSKLLLPFVGSEAGPMIVEFDLKTLSLDTLDITFDLIQERKCLWVSYNRAGSQIVYSNYPSVLGSGFASVPSEVGIVEYNTLQKKVFDIVPDNFFSSWITLFPEFVPNSDAVSFGAAPIEFEPLFFVGEYRLYVLKELPK